MEKQFIAFYGLIMLISMPLFISGHGDVVLTLQYEVTRTNEENNVWYNSDFSESYNYHLENSSSIIVERAPYLFDSSNSGGEIHISIGNLSRHDILDKELEENLALGYWMIPDMFGFFANTSWDLVKDDFATVSFNSSEIVLKTKLYLGGEIDVYQISFKDSFQETSLTYEKDTGYLLEADSVVFGFEIHFIISAINGDSIHFNTGNLSFNIFTFMLAIPFITKLHKKVKM